MKVVIVLGKRLNCDSSMKEELKERVRKGISCFKETKADILIFSGGKGNPFTKVSEAEKMLEYSISIDSSIKENIVLEKKSKFTSQNARFSKRLLDSRGVNPDVIYLVSSKYHFERKLFPKADNLFKRRFKNINIIKVY